MSCEVFVWSYFGTCHTFIASISLKSYLSAAEIWRNRHILCVRLPFDLTLTGTQTYAALANQQPVYVRHLRLSFKCFCITTSPDGNTSLYINEKPQMTHMFDLQYIRFGVKDDMVEKHVVTRKRSAASICTCCLQKSYGKGRVALGQLRKVSRYTYR